MPDSSNRIVELLKGTPRHRGERKVMHLEIIVTVGLDTSMGSRFVVYSRDLLEIVLCSHILKLNKNTFTVHII